MSSKKDAAKKKPDMPKCPICGRRSTVRKSGEDFFCVHCREMFRT